jgi:hypothetical protein
MLQSELDSKPYVLVYWEFSKIAPKLCPLSCSVYDGALAITGKNVTPIFIPSPTKAAIFKLASITSVMRVCASKAKDILGRDGLLC